MKIGRLILLVALGFIARSLYLFFLGSGGLAQFRELQGYREQLEANIEDLKRINAGLREELEALGSDPQRIALLARQLGYFQEGERVLRIEGYRAGQSLYTVGRIIRRAPEPERRDWLPKLLGLAVPLVLFLAWGLWSRRRHAPRGS